MSNHKNCNCSGECHEAVVEHMILPDGRRAERHVSYDADGNEVVEVFAEEKRPVKLEKRVTRKHKDIVAEEIVEMVKDGEIAHREVRSLEPQNPLQIVERIGVANHSKVVDGDYIRKDEVGKIVSDAVVEGVSALMESMNQPIMEDHSNEPLFNAQSQVEMNVEEKKKKNNSLVYFLVGCVFIEIVALAGYMYFIG